MIAVLSGKRTSGSTWVEVERRSPQMAFEPTIIKCVNSPIHASRGHAGAAILVEFVELITAPFEMFYEL